MVNRDKLFCLPKFRQNFERSEEVQWTSKAGETLRSPTGEHELRRQSRRVAGEGLEPSNLRVMSAAL